MAYTVSVNGVHLPGLGYSRGNERRGGRAGASHLDLPQDQLEAGADRDTVVSGRSFQFLAGSPVVADQETRDLGQQVAVFIGSLPQFPHRGGGVTSVGSKLNRRINDQLADVSHLTYGSRAL
jgi:hypothetical protein